MNPRLFVTMIVAAATTLCAPLRASAGASAGLVPIQLDTERRQMIGVTFAAVERRAVARRVEATGTIEPDEELQAYVQTRFAGWIQRVFANQTYQFVRRGAPLFTVYSPDLAATEREYLLALDARGRVAGSPVPGVADGAASLAEAARQRLALFGIPPAEIARLDRDRRPRDVMTIYSPADGYIVERNALPNMYVQPDTKIYSITNLSTVWVYAAVFQDDFGAVRPGDRAALSVDAWPGEEFAGAVDYIWPAIDAATRTVRVRLAFSSHSGKLRPGMYARVRIELPLGERLVIPADSVLRTGLRNLVFVDRGDGYLTPTEVVVGPRAGGDLVILRGLEAGQRVAASAGFLIDSESQLEAAAGAFVPPPPGVGGDAATSAEAANQLEIATLPNPPSRGHSALRATLRDSAGKPIAGARVNVTFFMPAMPAMGMSAMRVTADLADRGGGVYAGGVELPSGGTWRVTAIASRDGRTIASRRFNLSVAGGM